MNIVLDEAEVGSYIVAQRAQLAVPPPPPPPASTRCLPTRPRQEIAVKTQARKPLGRILLKGDNVTLIRSVAVAPAASAAAMVEA